MHSSPVSFVTQLNAAMVQTWYWTNWAGNTGTRKGTAACQWNWKNNYLNFVLRGFVPVLGEAEKLWMSGFIPTVLPLWCSCVRNGNSWFMLHYGPVSGNEHAQGEDSSRYDRCGKRQRAAWFSTFHEAWKNNFSKRLTTRERKKWQCHQKVLALVCANMCVCVLVPSFFLWVIFGLGKSGLFLHFVFLQWYPEFPSLELLISVCSQPKYMWQTPIPWPENLRPAPLVRANFKKNKTTKKTILYHSLPHFLCLLTQRELKRFACGRMCTCVWASQSPALLWCCSYSLVGVEFTPLHYHFLQRHWHSSGLNSSSRCMDLNVATWDATQDFTFTDFLWM